MQSCRSRTVKAVSDADCTLAVSQALSNSIWALAHLKSRGMDVDPLRQPNIMRFMNELAAAAARALARPHSTLQPPGSAGEPRLAEAQRYLALVEREFSCQVRRNNCWLANILVYWLSLPMQCQDGVCCY